MNDELALACSALVEAGFEQTSGVSFLRRRAGNAREMFVIEGEGFARFLRSDGAWERVPFRAAGPVDGAVPERDPAYFEWVYPAEYIIDLYTADVGAGEG